MKILVTGGAGFIGSNLVDELVKQNHDVFVIDNLKIGQKKYINKKAKLYEIDILDDQVSKIIALEKPDVVFHLAAQINVRESIENPISDCKENILGSINLLQAARKSGVKKIIFSSSGGAMYGDTPEAEIPTTENHKEVPMSPYGINKLAIEKYLDYYANLFDIDYTVLRYSNVYGPRQNSKGEGGVVAIFIDKMLNNQKPFIYGDGEQTRDMLYVADAVRANILALEKGSHGTYNIGMAKEVTVNNIFDIVKEKTGTTIEKEFQVLKKGDQRYSCLDNSLAKEKLTWQPEVGLEEGIEKTINYFKSL